MFFRGGSNMVAFCAKVDGTWQALSQRRLRYRFFLPPFSSLSPFSPFFLSFFSHFSLFPSLFSPFFQYFSFTSSHFLRFPALFGQSDASPCNPFVSNVPHEAQDNETDATCCERGFCLFLYFLTHSKKRSFQTKSEKKGRFFNFHVIRTLSFFSVEKWCLWNEEKFSRNWDPPKKRIPRRWKVLFFRRKTYLFEATFSPKLDRHEPKWPSKLTEPFRRLLAQWPSEMSRTPDPPFSPCLLSLPLLSLPLLSSLHEPLKPINSLGKRKMMIMMTIFDRTGGSYSWGRVPLRRQTLFGKSTIYQESTPKVCETVIPSDWKVDQESDRDWWSDHNSLRTANVKINDSTMWQSYWDYECQKPTSFRLRIMSGKY